MKLAGRNRRPGASRAPGWAATARPATFFPYDEDSLRPLCEAFDAFTPFQRFERAFEHFQHAWLRFGLERADAADFEWSWEFIADVHRVATRHQPEAAQSLAGVMRTSPSIYGAFIPAAPDEIPGLVERALETVRGWAGHPALAWPWLRIVVTAIHPFADCVDSLSRVAGCVALRRAGYGPPLLPTCNDVEYQAMFTAATCLGDRFDNNADVTPFLRWSLRAQIERALHAIDDMWIRDPARFDELAAVETSSGETALARAVRLARQAA